MATMKAIFKWPERAAPADMSALGAAVIAMPVHSGCAVPAACVAVVIDSGGRTRRAQEGSRLQLAPGEAAYAFHPGPYTVDLVPFGAAPELGLRVGFAVDSADPRVAQQRFDLFLASEAHGPLALAHFCQAVEAALQRALAQGNLELPPCTSLTEWNAFRAGFNQLLYMRFGVTVEECVPVDLGESVDFAAVLMARTLEQAPVAQLSLSLPLPRALAAASDPLSDARALRRLFLELPCVMCALRLAVLPPGQLLFRRHQDLLRRLDLVSLAVSSMPALELSAPGVALAKHEQLRRIGHSRRAVAALDEAWALLARVQIAGAQQLDALFDDGARIVANLEYDLGERRMVATENQPA
ncbi:hypothetical protein GCM10008020_38280 [Massilia psychrophila]|nr:hypothetical protein GCM10008020_38280 [Massilia psychrophila]